MSTPVAKGAQFEEMAGRFLIHHNMQLIERNFRSHRGEIDLVMLDGDCLVFVEVRYRRYTRFGSAAESVTENKQAKVILAANHFLQSHKQWTGYACRFDVVAINGHGTIDWIKDAFQPV
ncbi:MAG: YraN family protein [Gammaproteobacteria bacterium]|nr:YraN family protein [Gammaproteobacteria bacterium]